MKKYLPLFIVLVFIGIVVYFSRGFLFHCSNTDFPAYYRTATIILDPSIPNVSIYDQNPNTDWYGNARFVEYRYSMIVAYLMAPFALLPYATARTVMVLLGIFAYLLAVSLTLSMCGLKGRRYIYPLALSIFWFPLFITLKFAQVDTFILLLIVLGVLAASKNRPYLCGSLIAFAAMIKVFPLAIAMVFGLKNWRIIVSCVAVFGLSLLLPGTSAWIDSFAVQPFVLLNYPTLRIIFVWNWFVVIAGVIAGLTAFAAYRSKPDYFMLAALAIPAMLLTMPIIEYNHMLFLVFCYIYLMSKNKHLIPAVLSAALITLSFAYRPYMVVGLLVLWVPLLSTLISPRLPSWLSARQHRFPV